MSEATKKTDEINYFRDFFYLVFKYFFKIYFLMFGQPKPNEKVKRVMALYNVDNFTGWFKKIRFWDAPYIEVEKFIPKKGEILELGCGEGMFTNFMALCSSKRKILAVDIDANRLPEANRGLPNTSFKVGDATKVKIPRCDCIVMFHLLHHLLSRSAQEKLVEKVLSKMKKGSRLVIVEVDKKPFVKYAISWFTDHFIVAWLFENRLFERNIFFRHGEEWKKLIERNGFKVQLKRGDKDKPFSHVILIVDKIK